MSESPDHRERSLRHAEILAAVAEEEAEAAEAEVVGNLDIALHLRIDEALIHKLRNQASSEHISTSVLIRRILRQSFTTTGNTITQKEMETIARRVAREEISAISR